MTRFECFSPEMLRFFEELRANNTRDWFARNKATYETYVKEPGKQFAAEMAIALCDLTGQTHSTRIFRINRDVRFSKDKTPYNTHLHLAFTPDGPPGQPPMWFFGVSPEKLSLGCGVFQYDKAALAAFRQAMAQDSGAELIRLTAKLRSSGIRIAEPELKRVPAGFDKDHPNSEALRRKGFAAWIDKDDASDVTQPDLITRTLEDWRRLMPVFLFLSQAR